MKMQDYDKDLDILTCHWGNRTKHSIELFNGQLILDLDKEDNVVGFELMDFMKEVKKHNKKMDEIFAKGRNGERK